MKKIAQGKFEIFATKRDAIDRFMQLQGVCRENISGEKAIQFNCTSKGEIFITNPPTRRVEKLISIYLNADIIEQDGKTYVSYYTRFSKFSNVLKLISQILILIGTIFAFISGYKTARFINLLFTLFVVYEIYIGAKKKATRQRILKY